MAYTQTQWVSRALQAAGLVGEDENPTATQLDWAASIGTSMFDECIAQGVRFPAGSVSSLPTEYYRSFPSLVSYELKRVVGLISDADAEVAIEAQKRNIRAINWQQPSAGAAVAEYF